MSSLGGSASLASATSSHLDSACKHIQQCRVSQDHMIQFTKAPHDPEELVRNKYRYCMHKDELALSVGKCWGKQNGTKRFQNNAYPRVVSNLGQLVETAGDERSEVEKVIKLMYHHAVSIPKRDALLKLFQNGMPADFVTREGTAPYLKATPDGNMLFKSQLPYIYDFGATGYANTLGWAHSSSGDTMSSVMIGGLRTVVNGDFEVFCGDRIQWYWPFEAQCFTKDGRRKQIEMHDVATLTPPGVLRNNLQTDPAESQQNEQGQPHRTDLATRQRKSFEERQYGQRKGAEKMVPLIKPFKKDDEHPRLYDWYRVFADAISSAGPREKVDIRISRQAL